MFEKIYIFIFALSLVMSIGAYFNENYHITYKNPIVFVIPIAILMMYLSFYYSKRRGSLDTAEDKMVKIAIILLFWSFLTLPFVFENPEIWSLTTISIFIVSSFVLFEGEEK
ncbi:MAG: hypothetical protein LM587_01585 [Candidatus Aenigmarchaeota archaeon]|nr:hypothetical protein [Candidatus Aenigmarchaeota archaeon]